MKTKIHELKCVNPYFDDVWNGSKPFEIRENDRDYALWDVLILRLWDNEKKIYLGPEISVKVIYLTDYEQQPGFVVMGIKV